MAAVKRRYVAVIIALILIVGIPGYLSMYTSPDPDYSEPQTAAEGAGERTTEGLRADAPPAPVFPDLRRPAAPQPAAASPVASVTASDAPDYEEPESDPGASAYVSSCQPAAGVSPNPNAEGRRARLKIALAAPETAYIVQRLREAENLVLTQTAGRISLKFYPGGIMGSDADVIKKMQVRVLQGALLSPASLQEAVPALGIYRLPMLFRSKDEVAHLREITDPVLYDALLEAGYVAFCFAGNGFTRFFSKLPVRSEVDLRVSKVWVSEGDRIAERFLRLLEVSPASIPLVDLLVALQTGLLEVVTVPPLSAWVFQWYTQVDYMTDLPLTYDYSVLVIDAEAFEWIAPADQRIIAAALNGVLHDFDSASFSDSSKAIEAIARKGIHVVPANPGFRSQLEGLMREQTMAMIADGILPKDLTLQALQILADYRAAAP